MTSSARETPSYNIVIKKYATFSLYLTWRTGGDSSTPINNSNFSAVMQFRMTENSPSVLYEASSKNGQIVLMGESGTIKITIPASATGAMDFKEGVYDLFLTEPTGTVHKLIRGAIIVEQSVTKI